MRVHSLPPMLPGLLALLVMVAGAPAATLAADAAMRDSLHAFFARGIVHQGAKAELVQVLRWPETSGRLHWRVPHMAGHPARMSLIAEQDRHGQTQRWYVPVRVHWWARAVVARGEIPPRARLNGAELAVKRVDVAGLSGHWWQNPARLRGARTLRLLPAGSVLLSSSIRRPPLLNNGDRITLIAQVSGVRVRASGKVLRNANIGDRIRVQNLGSREILQATIIDARTARVEAGGA